MVVHAAMQERWDDLDHHNDLVEQLVSEPTLFLCRNPTIYLILSPFLIAHCLPGSACHIGRTLASEPILACSAVPRAAFVEGVNCNL